MREGGRREGGVDARFVGSQVMERAEGSQFTLVEELPEVETAMVNLKQTDAAYRFRTLPFPNP